MEAEKQIEIIEKKCNESGLNIYDVFRRALIPVSTIQNWRRKEPDAFKVKKKIDDIIEVMISEKESFTDSLNETHAVMQETPNLIVRRRRS